MDQEDFEAQALVGECPVCKAQQKNDQAIREQAARAAEADRGKTL
jgi:hypothetical protein